MSDLERLVRKVSLGGATVLVGGLLVALPAAPAAVAGECSSATGGSSDWVMWTGSSYTCAYQSKSDKRKIGSFNTQTWTHSTALGYTKREHKKKQTGGVDVSNIYYNGGSLGSSITFTAFNTEDGSRHWGAAVIWNTADGGTVSSSQYKGDGYEFKTNRFHVSKISVSGPSTVAAGTPASFSVKVSDPDGGSSPSGMIALMLQPGSKPSPTKTDCDGTVTSKGNDSGLAQSSVSGGAGTLTAPALGPGTYTMYAVYAGSVNGQGRPMYCESPPHDGLTGAQSSSWTLTVEAPGETRSATGVLSAPRETITPGLVAARSARSSAGPVRIAVVDRTFVTGRDGGAPSRPLACPAGMLPLQVNTASPTRVLPEQLLQRGTHRTGIRAGSAPEGTSIDVQLVCRDASAAPRTVGKIVLGSAHADRLRTRKPGSTVLAGAGADRVAVRTHGSSAFGFAGADRIVLTTARGSAHGGPGNDVIWARRAGAVLLVGGTGRDTLHGAPGRTLINARDGAGGDRIICESPKNVVVADAGDQIEGPCTVR